MAAVGYNFGKFQGVRTQGANVKHIEAQKYILDAVRHIVDGAGQTENILTLQGSDKFPDQLFHCLMFG